MSGIIEKATRLLKDAGYIHSYRDDSTSIPVITYSTNKNFHKYVIIIEFGMKRHKLYIKLYPSINWDKPDLDDEDLLGLIKSKCHPKNILSDKELLETDFSIIETSIWKTETSWKTYVPFTVKEKWRKLSDVDRRRILLIAERTMEEFFNYIDDELC